MTIVSSINKPLDNKFSSEENKNLSNTGENSFESILSKTSDKEVIEEEKDDSVIDKLLADIFSLMKTGMTVSEKESLQELLRALKKKIKEGNYSEKEIKDMLDFIEKQIVALQKRISGTAIKETDGSSLKNDNSTNTKNIEQELSQRIDDAMKALAKLSSGEEKNKIKETNLNEAELLELIKKFKD